VLIHSIEGLGLTAGHSAHYKSPGLLCHTAHVSADAKLTHKTYGTNSTVAKRLLRQKAAAVATMSASKTNISTAASAPRCQPKNNQVQRALAASCATNRRSPTFWNRTTATLATRQSPSANTARTTRDRIPKRTVPTTACSNEHRTTPHEWREWAPTAPAANAANSQPVAMIGNVASLREKPTTGPIFS